MSSIGFIWNRMEFDAETVYDEDEGFYIEKLFLVVKGKTSDAQYFRYDVSGLLEIEELANKFNDICQAIYEDDCEDDDIYRAEVDQLFDTH